MKIYQLKQPIPWYNKGDVFIDKRESGGEIRTDNGECLSLETERWIDYVIEQGVDLFDELTKIEDKTFQQKDKKIRDKQDEIIKSIWYMDMNMKEMEFVIRQIRKYAKYQEQI
mgnify:CR=1 FL=1